jgi:RNA 3'-terminal phosphate cyclase (ATP)
MLLIDGAFGEGGGQILRSALALSLLTGKPFRLENIRARRSKPGLMPQHLQAVQAAKVVGHAEVSGDRQGSGTLTFTPGEIRHGVYDFHIGTAGSTSLVLQTILVPLSLCRDSSTISISGGTHVRWSPCFHYLDWHWRSFMQQAGYDFSLSLDQTGFYPRGGGRITASIKPANSLQPLQLTKRGDLKSIQGLSAVANLNLEIAERQRRQALKRLADIDCDPQIEITQFPSPGHGTLLLLLARYEHSQCCFYSLGEKGKPAERVADEAVEQLLAFDRSGGTIDHYLADQLILPLAVVKGTSQLHSAKISNHLITNVEVVRQFLPCEIKIKGELGEPGTIEIKGCHP